eukprot:gnl/Chilomastix_cuspidata/7964.p2 GENE.gnl/Chilomastix_cuspidata/7964~~gnl/Chilomastix_cuspidata/7964.p2  ORF type:complete len:108 (-),score=3.74 gnl/Chilomastix_cuspidata/7964:115-438(-)
MSSAGARIALCCYCTLRVRSRRQGAAPVPKASATQACVERAQAAFGRGYQRPPERLSHDRPLPDSGAGRPPRATRTADAGARRVLWARFLCAYDHRALYLMRLGRSM